MQFDETALVVHGATVPMIQLDNTVWFRAKDCATVLGYKDSKKAIKTHVEEEWQKALQELLGVGGAKCPPTLNDPTTNDLSAKWIVESGLYELCCSSKLPLAKTFKKWVFGQVLPSIRKTGSYSLQQQQPRATATEDDSWCNKRLEGKELMKLKNASLQQLIAGGFGQAGGKLYAIAGNLINQAVLGFQETTKQFKKQQRLPGHVSIPDMLNMQGQVARCYAETCFQKFVTDNLERLRGLPESELLTEFKGLKINLRQGFVSTGMGDLQQKLLTVEEAKKRKAEQVCQARKRQRLLQMEQPKTIQCAA